VLNYRIDPQQGVIEITGDATIGSAETHGFLRVMVTDPGYRREFGHLRDRRGAPALTHPEIDRFISSVARVPGISSRWAVLVDHEAAFDQTAAAPFARWVGITLRVFTDEAEARRWLAAK
jgi:hypothetical protein